MSGGLNFHEDCKNAYQELKKDKSTINWFTMEYDPNKKDYIILKDKGNGGYDEFIKKLDETVILYCCFKVKGIDDESSVRIKFVYVSWIGKKVSPLKRARVSTHKAAVEGFLNGVHCSFQVNEVEDISKEAVIQKLNNVTGAHKPKSYLFSDDEPKPEEKKEEEPEKKEEEQN